MWRKQLTFSHSHILAKRHMFLRVYHRQIISMENDDIFLDTTQECRWLNCYTDEKQFCIITIEPWKQWELKPSSWSKTGRKKKHQAKSKRNNIIKRIHIEFMWYLPERTSAEKKVISFAIQSMNSVRRFMYQCGVKTPIY